MKYWFGLKKRPWRPLKGQLLIIVHKDNRKDHEKARHLISRKALRYNTRIVAFYKDWEVMMKSERRLYLQEDNYLNN